MDIERKNGKLASATIKSGLGNKAKIRYGDQFVEFETSIGESLKLNDNLIVIN